MTRHSSLIAISLLMISGCAQFSATECVWTREIRPSKDDVLTRGTQEQILAHNLSRQDNCR